MQRRAQSELWECFYELNFSQCEHVNEARVCVWVESGREIIAVPVMHTLSDTCCSKECWVEVPLHPPRFAVCVMTGMMVRSQSVLVLL